MRPLRMVGDDGPPKRLAYERPDGSFDWEELAARRAARIDQLVTLLRATCSRCGQVGRSDPDAGGIDPCEDVRGLASARGKRIDRLNMASRAPCRGCGLRGEVPT